jgi:hypothetical protein
MWRTSHPLSSPATEDRPMNNDHSERPLLAPTTAPDDSTREAPARRPRSRELEFRYFIDQRGRQHFNFQQTIWLDPSVDMAFTRVYSTALKTLAANLLALTLDEPGRTAVRLAPAFSRECLMGAPDRAWALPRSTIQSWLESKRRCACALRVRRGRARVKGSRRQPHRTD